MPDVPTDTAPGVTAGVTADGVRDTVAADREQLGFLDGSGLG